MQMLLLVMTVSPQTKSSPAAWERARIVPGGQVTLRKRWQLAEPRRPSAAS